MKRANYLIPPVLLLIVFFVRFSGAHAEGVQAPGSVLWRAAEIRLQTTEVPDAQLPTQEPALTPFSPETSLPETGGEDITQPGQTTRPTSTPPVVPPPSDPNKTNLMIGFGVLVVLVIVAGVWANRRNLS